TSFRPIRGHGGFHPSRGYASTATCTAVAPSTRKGWRPSRRWRSSRSIAATRCFPATSSCSRRRTRRRAGERVQVGSSSIVPAFFADFTRNARQNALIRNTITPTVLQGSAKTNVIPDEATAQLDCRLLPGERPADFVALLREVVGDENVRIETLLSFPASAS